MAGAARSASEAVEAITPFWRVLAENAQTAKRLPVGTNFIRAQRTHKGLP